MPQAKKKTITLNRLDQLFSTAFHLYRPYPLFPRLPSPYAARLAMKKGAFFDPGFFIKPD